MADVIRPASEAQDPIFWRDVEEAFSAVIEAGDAARTSALAQHCGERQALRAEVELLLAAHTRAGDFMAPGALASAGETSPFEALPIPTRIGAFDVKERIGEGGMGAVYRAERVEGGFQQQVAVKLIASRLYGAETLRRFRAEQQILASLQHPNIVALLDGGVTADGNPYIVMEHVQGVPVTHYCRERRLPLRERLKLFQQLCAAVSYAHRHLVVHRDLKPANVLVTAEGAVKVLDFGVAKLLEPDRERAEATGALLGPLTPDYASPEQIRGAPVSTACDVYAMGVVLYELVAGRKPYTTAGRTFEELVTLVGRDEPPRPSTAAADGMPYDGRSLRGDLDALVAVAMAKEAERRYASAVEMADDVQRWLEGRPIAARRPSLRYLAGKAILRHKAAFAVAGVFLVLLFGALGSALWQGRVAARERERAERRFDDVRQLSGAMIFKLHDQIANLAGSTEARRTVIAEGLKFLEVLQADPAADRRLKLDVGRGYSKIGLALGGPNSSLGDRAGALAAQRKARDVLRELVTARDASDAESEAWIDANVALCSVADGKERDDALQAALDGATEWFARAPSSLEAQDRLAKVHFRKASLIGHPRSLPHWREANRLFEALLAAAPGDSNRMRNVALTQKYLGGYFGISRDHATELQHYRRAYDLDQARVRASPDDATAQLDLAIDISNIASAHLTEGDYDRAIAGYEETLSIRRRLSEADPKNAWARGRVGYAHQQLAQSHHRAGHRELARRHIAQAFEVYGRTPDAGFFKAEAYLTLAEVEGGRTPAGCAAYRNADRQLTEAAAAGKLNSGADEKRAFAARKAAACRGL